MRNIRIIILGFSFGFIAVFIATLGLAIRFIETIKPVLIPGKYVLNLFNIPQSIILLVVVNAITYSLIFSLADFLLGKKSN